MNGTVLREGDLIAIDGSAGIVTADDVPLEEPEVERPTSRRVLEWADELRTLGVRTNADTPEDAAQARASSAPRASASAAPSTCSWPPTASRRCAR